jgi:hypothetical protein
LGGSWEEIWVLSGGYVFGYCTRGRARLRFVGYLRTSVEVQTLAVSWRIRGPWKEHIVLAYIIETTRGGEGGSLLEALRQ